MKTPRYLVLLILAWGLVTSALQAQQRTVQTVHREGVALFNEGKFADALQKFNLVLKHQPSYVYARVYANKCELAIKQDTGPKADIEATLAKIILPSVEFEDVPLSDALTYIRQRAEELSGGKVTPNIIFSGSAEQRDASKVTMKLTRVPVTTLLKYVGDQTSCRIRYDEHAIMVTPQANIPKPVAKVKEEKPNPFDKTVPNPFQ